VGRYIRIWFSSPFIIKVISNNLGLVTMAMHPGLVKAVSNIPGIGMPEISETQAGWRSSLLSGKEGNDLVTLYKGNSSNGDALLISESHFSENTSFKNVGQMIESNSLKLGYPMYYIKEALGLKDIPLNTAYPLLYRSASIVLEAERLHIKNAILILESSELTPTLTSIYQDFANLLSTSNQINCLHQSNLPGRANFYFGLFDSKQNQFQ